MPDPLTEMFRLMQLEDDAAHRCRVDAALRAVVRDHDANLRRLADHSEAKEPE